MRDDGGNSTKSIPSLRLKNCGVDLHPARDSVKCPSQNDAGRLKPLWISNLILCKKMFFVKALAGPVADPTRGPSFTFVTANGVVRLKPVCYFYG
jgi:hypothetical protein